jgi:hypothetical protein
LKLGLAGLHFHDLRHAGNIWASKAGMSTKDLMTRMGHDDMRAALIYQRATSETYRRPGGRVRSPSPRSAGRAPAGVAGVAGPAPSGQPRSRRGCHRGSIADYGRGHGPSTVSHPW